MLPGGVGRLPVIQLGSLTRRTLGIFSLASAPSRFQPYQPRSAFPSHMQRTSARAGVARIHGTGRRSRIWWESRRRRHKERKYAQVPLTAGVAVQRGGGLSRCEAAARQRAQCRGTERGNFELCWRGSQTAGAAPMKIVVRLSETAQTWGRAIAPVAEWVARILWQTLRPSFAEIRFGRRLAYPAGKGSGDPALLRHASPLPLGSGSLGAGGTSSLRGFRTALRLRESAG